MLIGLGTLTWDSYIDQCQDIEISNLRKDVDEAKKTIIKQNKWITDLENKVKWIEEMLN